MIARPQNPPSTSKPAVRLGDWLIEQGHISQSQLDLALREQKRKQGMLGELLVNLGFVNQETIAGFLASRTESEMVSLADRDIPVELLKLVPLEMAKRLEAIPLALEKGELRVAIADPLNVLAFDTLEQTTGMRVNLVAASEDEIANAIEKHYATRQSVDDIVDELLKYDSETLASTTEEDGPMIRLVDRIIAEAVSRGASDIHVQPEERVLRVRMRTDGVLEAGIFLPKEIQPALTARLKIISKLDITESRRPQGGRTSVQLGNRRINLRVSTLPTSHGESIVMRILDNERLPLKLDLLGFAPDIIERFSELLSLPHGVILVTGPTGSGKTTTLYAALNMIDANEKSVFTLEDPIEYQLPLIRQTQVSETIGLTFSEGLRTLLRQDPDIILVGETRDPETAQLMTRAALTGHLVFSTLHTNNAVGAVPRLIDLGVEPYLLGPTLNGVLAQRLVRRLCKTCRKKAEAAHARALVNSLGLASTDAENLWEPAGCEDCHQTGYSGRVGIHELITFGDEERKFITHNTDVASLLECARKNGFRTMYEDGLAKALQGHTTVGEILRVTQR